MVSVAPFSHFKSDGFEIEVYRYLSDKRAFYEITFLDFSFETKYSLYTGQGIIKTRLYLTHTLACEQVMKLLSNSRKNMNRPLSKLPDDIEEAGDWRVIELKPTPRAYHATLKSKERIDEYGSQIAHEFRSILPRDAKIYPDKDGAINISVNWHTYPKHVGSTIPTRPGKYNGLEPETPAMAKGAYYAMSLWHGDKRLYETKNGSLHIASWAIRTSYPEHRYHHTVFRDAYRNITHGRHRFQVDLICIGNLIDQIALEDAKGDLRMLMQFSSSESSFIVFDLTKLYLSSFQFKRQPKSGLYETHITLSSILSTSEMTTYFVERDVADTD